MAYGAVLGRQNTGDADKRSFPAIADALWGNKVGWPKN